MYTPFDLSGRGAVVTGGNGGIGLGMARALLQAGAKVAIWGSNPDKTLRAKATLAEASQPVLDQTRATAAAADGYVRGNPWAAIGIAIAAGALIGLLAAKR